MNLIEMGATSIRNKKVIADNWWLFSPFLGRDEQTRFELFVNVNGEILCYLTVWANV